MATTVFGNGSVPTTKIEALAGELRVPEMLEWPTCKAGSTRC